MPYIKQEDRVKLSLDGSGTKFIEVTPENSGELNFLLTSVIQEYHAKNGGRYLQVNDVLGALEGAKLEFYARVARPYEDEKILENSDVMLLNKYRRSTDHLKVGGTS